MSMQIVMELAVGDLRNYYKGKLDKEMERPYSDAEGLVAWVLSGRLFCPMHVKRKQRLISFAILYVSNFCLPPTLQNASLRTVS